MISRRSRAVPLIAVLSVILAGLLASTASAAVTSSNITSPGDLTYPLVDTTATPTTITVTGTTVGVGNVDINCYYGEKHVSLAKEVEVTGNEFSITAPAANLEDAPCVLRAVPEGDTTEYSPGDPSAFAGPRLAISFFENYTNSTSKIVYGYDYEQTTLTSFNEFEPAVDCGLDYSALYAPGSLRESDKFFDCNGALFRRDYPTESRSEIQVGGENAYDPYAANELNKNLGTSNPPSISVTKSFASSSGDVTIHEIDPIVKCTNSSTFPPTSASCESFASTGVQLERTWQTSHEGQLIAMTDVWRSTDGAGHSLNTLYDQYLVHSGEGGSYQFPGRSGFSETKSGDTVSLPSGSGTILYKESKDTPDGGDLEHPQGAIVYDSAPSEGVRFEYGTNESSYDEFRMPYQRTIPAGGTYTLRMAYVQAYSLSEVNSLAAEAKAAYTAPSVSISSPVNGASVSTPTVLVSGSASDAGGLASLTVNGQSVSVTSSGTWSTTVPLTAGANTITATATNDAGVTSNASIAVTYTPAVPVVPPAHLSKVGSVSGANGKVTFTLACIGTAGTRCTVKVTLTTIEKLHGKKINGVVARLRSKRVSLGTVTLSIPAGTKVKISLKLNALGRRLLAHFHKLPLHLSAVLSTPGVTKTVVAQNVVVRPVKKHKKKHH